MADGHSDYHHGDMPVGAQKHTFIEFMDVTKYGGTIISMIVLMPTLMFGVGLAWLPSLAITFIFGVIVGIILRFKPVWYVGLVAVALLAAIIAVVIGFSS